MADYNIHTDIKYGFSRLIDIPALNAEHEPWFNQSLCEVNDCVVRLGILHGEFHWHKHDEEDEFFLVLEGRLFIDIEAGDTVELGQHQGYTVPKGTVHKTRCPERSVILMVERASVVPTGD